MSDAQVADESQNLSEPNRPLEYVVRFGSMRILGVMTSKQPYRYGDEVVARSSRGTEIGRFRIVDVLHATDFGDVLVAMRQSLEIDQRLGGSLEIDVEGREGEECGDDVFDLLGGLSASITHPDDLSKDGELKAALFSGAIPSFKMEKRYLRKNGEAIWVAVTGPFSPSCAIHGRYAAMGWRSIPTISCVACSVA